MRNFFLEIVTTPRNKSPFYHQHGSITKSANANETCRAKTLRLLYLCNNVRVKTCQLNVRVYNVLYLCISAPLYEARCSKNSDIGFLYVRHRSRHTSLYALLLNRHPCRFWLVCEQSSKNI